MIRIKCRASAGETAAPARQHSARAANRSTILWAITGADALHAPGFEKFVAGNCITRPTACQARPINRGAICEGEFR